MIKKIKNVSWLNLVFDKNYKANKEKENILQILRKLQILEAKLWGVIIYDLKDGEELILEDTNHLIYLINNQQELKLKNILKLKEVEKFLEDIENIKKDFNLLKKQIREKDRLKLLISNFTIKLIDSKNYENFKKVFLLEKDLSQILEKQDKDLNFLINDLKQVKINSDDEKIEFFIENLKKIRKILSGHIDEFSYLEKEERSAYSDTSNLIYELIQIFETKIIN